MCQGSPLASVESFGIVVSIYESVHTPAVRTHCSPPVDHLDGTNPDCCKSSTQPKHPLKSGGGGEVSHPNQPSGGGAKREEEKCAHAAQSTIRFRRRKRAGERNITPALPVPVGVSYDVCFEKDVK